MKRLRMVVTVLLLSAATSGCMYAIRYDGTYRGRVVDAESREPIECAVALGTWSVLHPNAAGGYHTYYDAREAITDKNGEFSIPGQGLRIMSNLEPMSVFIFKAGYSYEQASWDSLKTGMYLKDRIKWEGNRPVFQLHKLSKEERAKQGGPPDPPDQAPYEKVKLILKEINKDDTERGLKGRMLWRGHKIY